MGLFKSNKKFECTQDSETKELTCESFRENSDGSRVQLAKITAQVDGMCNPIITNASESEDGELEALEKKVQGRIVSKCQKKAGGNKPADY